MNFLIQVLISVVVSAIAYAISPKPKIQGPTAGKLNVPATQLGAPIQVVFGEDWIENAAISYYGNTHTTPVKVKSGK